MPRPGPSARRLVLALSIHVPIAASCLQVEQRFGESEEMDLLTSRALDDIEAVGGIECAMRGCPQPWLSPKSPPSLSPSSLPVTGTSGHIQAELGGRE